MTRLSGEDPTGVLLAAPAGRQPGCRDQADPLVGRDQLLDNRGCPVCRVVVQDNHLELDSLVPEGGTHGIADRVFFIPRGDKHGDWREFLSGRGAGGWSVSPQIGPKQ